MVWARMEMEEVESRDTKRDLESRAVGRLSSLCNGPYNQHNYMIRCAQCLQEENPEGGQGERLWKIFPTGGFYSKVGDIIAWSAWLVLVVYPCVTIPTACYCRNEVNIINAVILSILTTYHLLAIYIIFTNTAKFKSLWYICKAETEKYTCLQNYVTEATLLNVKDLEFVTPAKRKKIITHLALQPHGRAMIMLCTRSFWRSRMADPVISLVGLTCLYLASVIVQIELLEKVQQ